MSRRRRLLTGAASLVAGQGLSQGLSFLRNLLIASFVAPADFGIAATFVITVSVFEMLSYLAAEKLIVQAPDGDDPRLQDTAHFLQLCRGLAAALLTLALAGPLAALFDVPHARWAFSWLALVPLLRGLAHLDLHRLQRELRFFPAVIAEAGGQAMSLLGALPLALFLRDYSSMLWVLILQAAATAAVSHLVARRPYRLRLHRAWLSRLFAFGWPLLINGLLMFAIFQGDRLIVGSLYSMHELGLYSLAFALSFAPVSLLANISVSLLLPLLSRVQSAPDEFSRRYAVVMQSYAMLAGVLAIALILLGPWVIAALFGASYAGAGLILVYVALLQAARILRIPPTVAAMALGDTRSLMLANLGRCLGVFAALVAALRGLPLEVVVLSGVAGELLAFAIAAVRLGAGRLVLATLSFSSSLTIASILLAVVLLLPHVGCDPAVRLLSLLLLGALVLAATLLFPATRLELHRWLAELRRRAPVCELPT